MHFSDTCVALIDMSFMLIPAREHRNSLSWRATRCV